MQISHSNLASNQKEAFLKEFPGLKRHFSELEKEIQTNPKDGTKEIMMSGTGRGTLVRTMSAKTEIFGGVASYSKELVAVYICSDNFTMGRIIPFLF